MRLSFAQLAGTVFAFTALLATAGRADEPAPSTITLTAAAPTTAPSAERQLYLSTVRDAGAIYDLEAQLVGGEQKVRAAYIGIGVQTPGDTLRAQLALPKGAGLVVNWIDENGPSKGIIRLHDVIQKIDQQILINPPQLVTLVRLHKPGEVVAVTLIRESRPMTVTLAMAEKEVAPLRSYLQVDGQADQAVLNALDVNTFKTQEGALSYLPYIRKLFLVDGAGAATTQPAGVPFLDPNTGQATTTPELAAVDDSTRDSTRVQPHPTTNDPVRLDVLSSPGKRPMMGINTSAAGDDLRAQLLLPEGVGLVVNAVDADGPCRDLVHTHDVLHKLDEQILTNPEQLSALVQMHQPGQTVELSLIRAARPITVAVKLGDRAAAATDGRQTADDDVSSINQILGERLVLLGAPTTQPDRAAILRRMTLDLTGVPPTESEVNEFVQDKSPDAYQKVVDRLIANSDPRERGVILQLRGASGLATTQPALATFTNSWNRLGIIANGDVVTRATRSGPVTIDDGQLMMWLQSGPDGQNLSVIDRATGKSLFNGPISSPEQWKTVPEDIRQKFESWRDSMQRAAHAPPDKKQ
jgi:hypothetical protein